MNIRSDSWHLRVYQWWYKNKYHSFKERDYANLCPYMRAVMFWAPLRAIFGTWVKIGKIPINAVTIPALLYAIPTLLGYHNYQVKMFVWVIYAVVLGFCLVFSAGYTISWVFEDGPMKGKVGILGGKVADSSFCKLLREYLRSAHDRICPEISWHTENE